MAAMKFGVTLPQIKRSWDQTRAAAEELERLGFDSVWVNDHLYGVPMPNVPILEAWTLLTAVAAVTRRVELGTLVTPVGFRNPALLAKQAATLDNVSSGRLIVGLGVGWFEMEFSGYGLGFPPVGRRLEQLGEAVVLMKRLWTEPQVTFEGRHFCTKEVFCEPKPVRRPPVLIGGGGEKKLLRLVAEHADVWNNLGIHLADLEKKTAVLRAHCEDLGRDPTEILVSQQTLVVVGRDEDDARAKTEKAERIYGGHMGPGLSGTPEQLVDRIGALRDQGCGMLVMELFGKDIREPARLFSEKVMPAFA